MTSVIAVLYTVLAVFLSQKLNGFCTECFLEHYSLDLRVRLLDYCSFKMLRVLKGPDVFFARC